MEALRAMVPSWFIFAGILSAFLLGLKGPQMAAAILFGGFLCEITYALFFDQTLGLLMKKPSPNLRYMVLAFAAVLLFVSWFLWTRQP